ncbi:Longitudinals lacking protein-like [Orchesella cincta]|uniref:Longitudinals lacking protein-like n=1 Tax=Orchesella cincta TaxID=48709 RepID=A0A1D2M2L4_ORCCI|nr:Longitudinals lacking protein-like [Orchesella cincta]
MAKNSAVLKLKNPFGTASNQLEEFFGSEKLSDVSLVCDGQILKCHRMVLAAGSHYFKEELSKNPRAYPIFILTAEVDPFLKASKNLAVKGIFDENGEIKIKTGAKGKSTFSRIYTQSDMVAAIESVRNGMSGYAAARAFKIPVTTLYDNLSKNGVSVPRKRENIWSISHKDRKYTDQDLAAAIQDVRNGKSLYVAARAYNIPNTTLHSRVRKLGSEQFPIGKLRRIIHYHHDIPLMAPQ